MTKAKGNAPQLSEQEKRDLVDMLASLTAREPSRRTQAMLSGAGMTVPDRSWIIMHVAPRAEYAVDKVLCQAEIEAWLPGTEWVPVRRGGKSRSERELRKVPAYPGYLFAKVPPTIAVVSGLLRVQGVHSVLFSSGFKPYCLRDKEVCAIKDFLQDDDAKRAVANAIKAGDRVQIQSGPMRLFEAVVTSVVGHDKGDHVWVDMDLLGQMVPLKLPLAELKRVS